MWVVRYVFTWCEIIFSNLNWIRLNEICSAVDDGYGLQIVLYNGINENKNFIRILLDFRIEIQKR